MATAKDEIDDIRHRMALLRRELHADVRDVVASAEAVTDWHRYIRNYPWAALAGAFALGYLAVPRRRESRPPDRVVPDAIVAPEAPIRETVAKTPKEKAESSLIGAAWALVAPIALRAAQGYAVQFLENWMTTQARATGPPPRQSSERTPGPGVVSR